MYHVHVFNHWSMLICSVCLSKFLPRQGIAELNNYPSKHTWDTSDLKTFGYHLPSLKPPLDIAVPNTTYVFQFICSLRQLTQDPKIKSLILDLADLIHMELVELVEFRREQWMVDIEENEESVLKELKCRERLREEAETDEAMRMRERRRMRPSLCGVMIWVLKLGMVRTISLLNRDMS
jgi:hypothetical protein